MKKGINRWSLPADWSIRQCMETAKAAGFEGIELALDETGELSLETDAPGVQAQPEVGRGQREGQAEQDGDDHAVDEVGPGEGAPEQQPDDGEPDDERQVEHPAVPPVAEGHIEAAQPEGLSIGRAFGHGKRAAIHRPPFFCCLVVT